MPKFPVKLSDYAVISIDGKNRNVLAKEASEAFNESLLGLGDLTKPSVPREAIAAVFDLEGFTNFCKQIDPHLSVPLFLGEFLSWIVARLKAETIVEEVKEGVVVYCPLPFFLKFMGDGILVIWDTAEMTALNQRNIIVSARSICSEYEKTFHPLIRRKVTDAPTKLRCGVARGVIYSVGDGDDFVGSCINMAARLQKLPGITFAFNRRGFDLHGEAPSAFFKEHTVVKRVAIRGIGENELVSITKQEFEKLRGVERKFYKDP